MRTSDRKSKYGLGKPTYMENFSKVSNENNQTVKDPVNPTLDNEGGIINTLSPGDKSDLISNIGNSESNKFDKGKGFVFPDHTKRKFPLPKPKYTFQ